MALHTHQDAYLTTKIRWKLVPFRGIQKNTRLVRWPQRLSMRSVVPWWGSPSYQTFLRRSTSSTSPTKNSSRVWKIQWRPELSQELNHILVTFSAMVKTYSHEKSALAVVACHWSQFLRKTHKKCRMGLSVCDVWMNITFISIVICSMPFDSCVYSLEY